MARTERRAGWCLVAFATFATIPFLAIAEEQTSPIYFQYCSGAILRAAPEADPGVFALALLRGKAWASYGRAIYDSEGQMLRQEVVGRGIVRFDPHNCEKSVGICEYTEIAFDGPPQRKLRITGHEGIDAAWTYSLVDIVKEGGADKQVLSRVGTVNYAEDGLAIRETWSSITGTEDGCLERIDAAQLPAGAQSE